jgi:hypothetical protein
MTFCANCKWRKARHFFGIQLAFFERKTNYEDSCVHPSTLDLVTGEGEKKCSTMRAYQHLCGPDGKYWEPRTEQDRTMHLLSKK